MTNPPDEPSLADDRRWCFRAVEDVSRTFALSIELLEEPIDSWVCTGYLLCRGADTIEDEAAIPLAKRAELLDIYRDLLDPTSDTDVATFLDAVEAVRPPAVETDADWEVLMQTDRVLRVFRSFDPAVSESMRGIVREMATGMAEILRRHDGNGGLRLATVDELEEYCWYVAGTVGELFTTLLAHVDSVTVDEPDPDDAWAFALLLQLVNIAKDVRLDYETEDNVYLPGEWLAAEGIDHEAVADAATTDQVAAVVQRVIAHAESQTDGARQYLATLPEDEGRVLEAAALPYLLAIGTLRELEGQIHDVVTEPATVKLDRQEVEALYQRMQHGITQSELDTLIAEVRADPSVDAYAVQN
ncbi:MAG: phytoene/squalene synthase family protein [Halobacteriales archaeon]